MSYKVNLAHVQAILDKLGRSDIQLPVGIDGAQVTVDLPAIVSEHLATAVPLTRLIWRVMIRMTQASIQSLDVSA